jgi:RNA polymerase sigma-70 factor, ECF subfamily
MHDRRAPSLEELLHLAAGGSSAALRQIYDREAPRLFAVALRILRRRDLAADAVQDAFVQIWRRADRFDDAAGSGAAWITSIVRYRALDAVRRGAREELGAEAAGSLLVDESDILGALERREETRALRRCLEALEEKNRRCIMLAFLDGLSHAEIAEHLDAPLGTVKSWVRRGLGALRECLGS